MSDDFDLAHDKLPDQPVTIGGDKSAAAWHGVDAGLSTLDKVTASYDEALREARAERDALAYALSLVRGDMHLTQMTPNPNDIGAYVLGQVAERAILDTAPAVSLALHDAEVKAQALDEAANDAFLWNERDAAGRLRARAAAIRKAAL